jgi:hypothetical protein
LFLCGEFLADVTTVDSATPVQCDWFAHADSRELVPFDSAAKFSPTKLSQDNGYQHLADPLQHTATGDLRMDFVAANDQRLAVWLIGAAGEQVVTTTGIGYTINAKVPCLMRRRHGQQVHFATVYDLSGAGTGIVGVSQPKNAPQTLVVKTPAGQWNLDFAGRKFSSSGK